MRTKYDGSTRSYVQRRAKDEIMPASNTKNERGHNFINGAPFGQYDDTKPVGQSSRAKGKSKD